MIDQVVSARWWPRTRRSGVLKPSGSRPRCGGGLSAPGGGSRRHRCADGSGSRQHGGNANARPGRTGVWRGQAAVKVWVSLGRAAGDDRLVAVTAVAIRDARGTDEAQAKAIAAGRAPTTKAQDTPVRHSCRRTVTARRLPSAWPGRFAGPPGTCNLRGDRVGVTAVILRGRPAHVAEQGQATFSRAESEQVQVAGADTQGWSWSKEETRPNELAAQEHACGRAGAQSGTLHSVAEARARSACRAIGPASRSRIGRQRQLDRHAMIAAALV